VGWKIYYKEIKLTCEKMLFGGFGLSRTKHGVVFVEGLLPGESAQCNATRNVSGILIFTASNILEKSPHRRTPFCSKFGTCGGCDWQFMDYETQVECKKEIFESTLKRTGKIYEFPEPKVYFDAEKGYRIRAKFSVNEKTGEIGFQSKRSHDVIKIDKCSLLTENLNEFLKNANANKPKARTIFTIDTKDGVVSSLDRARVGRVSVGEYEFEVNGNSFFQSNRFLTPVLANWCAEQVEGSENLFDLYGGVGLFSVFCSKKVKNITLVETDRDMARLAQKTFEINGVSNAKAIASKAEDYVLSESNHSPDCIIVDPPRIGLKKRMIDEIIKIAPKKIIYIACDPATQARDCNFFVSAGYKITKTAVFDCYPNTFHIESGIVLER